MGFVVGGKRKESMNDNLRQEIAGCWARAGRFLSAEPSLLPSQSSAAPSQSPGHSGGTTSGTKKWATALISPSPSKPVSGQMQKRPIFIHAANVLGDAELAGGNIQPRSLDNQTQESVEEAGPKPGGVSAAQQHFRCSNVWICNNKISFIWPFRTVVGFSFFALPCCTWNISSMKNACIGNYLIFWNLTFSIKCSTDTEFGHS